MPTEVILPKVDMDMATGRISRWFVSEGDVVKKGDVLFEIETDKAAMEIDAPASGTLGNVIGKEGVDIPVGAPVAWIYAGNETPQPAAERSEPAATAAGVSQDPARVAHDAGLPARQPAPFSGLRATPLARRIARQNNVDLTMLKGSGPKGRIQARDVGEAASSPRAESSAARPAETARPAAPPASVARASSGGAQWLRQDGEGAPIVLIHGFGSDTASWRPFLGAFTRPVPILSIDLPGHGKAADVEADSFDDLVAYVENELAAHDVAVAHLVGHSLGGAVATAVAAGIGIETRSLFLLAPAGIGPEINTGFTQGFAAATDEATLRIWMRELVGDPAVLSDSFVKATVRARADGSLSRAQTRLEPRLFSNWAQRFSTRALFDHLAMPTKIVAGAADRIIPSRQAQGLPGHVGLHLFAGIGHMPQLEAREAVARLLTETIR